MDFDTVAAELPNVPTDSASLERALAAVPLIDQWCKAIYAEVDRRVREGITVIGSDGKPMKIVEGKQGDRAWIDEAQAEAALLGVLPIEKAYKPAAIITAAAAAKILDKKQTKEQWKDVFVPLIKRAPGKPVLALGSDTRPPFSGSAAANEFSDIVEE
jgi:hypothetical protein